MGAVFFLDQLTKIWVERTIPYGSFYNENAVVIIPGFFRMVHVGNTGAAWSMFSGQGDLLATLGIVALIAIFLFRNALELDVKINQLGFGLATGGILGNVIDRFRLGHVTDFLDFSINGHHWPSFNVADCGITVGVAIYTINSIFFDRQKTEEG